MYEPNFFIIYSLVNGACLQPKVFLASCFFPPANKSFSVSLQSLPLNHQPLTDQMPGDLSDFVLIISSLHPVGGVARRSLPAEAQRKRCALPADCHTDTK